MANIGDSISIIGYDVVASAQCDYGAVLVLNNNSSHYLVVETEIGGTDGPDGAGRLITMFNPTAVVIGVYPYYDGGARVAYRMALTTMQEKAIALTEDN